MSSLDSAIRLLADRKYHQCFRLAATDKHEELRVTFATSTNFDDNVLPVVLFVGPMFGSRYFCTDYNKLAISSKIRFICVDRPGFGGSSNVPIEDRVNIWLETVPQLLKHLNVNYVSLISHSAGTIYLLNTLYHLRHILDPKRPYVALLAPWVSQEHSGVTMLSLASKLPNAAFSGWSGLVGFINRTLVPAGSWSGGIISSSASLFQSSPSEAEVTSEETAQARWGTDAATVAAIDGLQAKYCWAECMSGANDEARLCLGGGKGLWGVCEDYSEYVRKFCAAERQRSDADRLLELHVVFATSDIMIGTGGKAYFEEVWGQDCVAGCVDVKMVQAPGTNHETVLNFEKGLMHKIFKDIGGNAA
ncbi:hypothetical protein CB0940_00985 [Cercospora beticola]|uniref:AB hydrolase-1 domain-containing protein n=1 Tax=Cercospora beticola TaxID=122368 RepID=A0A2G5I9Y4_CERBT|nr:hypothetical protein CB0940_00985 [Cercospora beticola]PIB01512.1 hypothetical protein CB0940_00985 [Cercospora beticola]WPA96409.1 hypothetical protein RHO25_001016 [Cercospora beticola]